MPRDMYFCPENKNRLTTSCPLVLKQPLVLKLSAIDIEIIKVVPMDMVNIATCVSEAHIQLCLLVSPNVVWGWVVCNSILRN